MAEEKQILEEQLHAAQDLHERHTSALREIHELLAKADARRKAEPENQRRWNQVLDHLESSLVQARARVSASEHGLSVARRALQDALGKEALEAAEASHEETGEHVSEATSFETRLEKVIGVENAAAALNDTVSADDLPAKEDEPATGHQILQSAIEKIQGHRVHALDAQEVKATIAAYDRLTRIPSPSLKDQRLIRILGAAVKIFQRTARRNR